MYRRIVAVSCAAIMLWGCSSTHLETGYRMRKLGDSHAARRTYYTSPYTPEARAAQMEREQEFDARRPRPGY